MKRIIFLLTILVTVASCSQDETTNKEAERIDSLQLELVNENHKSDFDKLRKEIFRKLESDEVSVLDFDQFYKTEIKPSKDENLMNIAFFALVKKGLLDNSTDSKIQIYYLKEQESLQQNLLNIKSFYGLLEACESDLSKEELLAIEESFFEKNYDRIVNQQWEDKARQNEHKISLVQSSKLFKRYQNNK